MSQCDRILAFLSDGRPHRMEEVHQAVGFCRLNSRIAELRSRGHVIVCEKTKRVYVYRLVGAPLKEEPGVGQGARDLGCPGDTGLGSSLSGGPDLPGNDMPPATEGSEGVGRVAAHQLSLYDALEAAAA